MRRTTSIVPGVLAVLTMATAIRAAEAFDWMPPASLETALAAEPADGSPVPDIALTPTPKATANLAQYTREVVLDLKRFNIRNDGTEAEATSIGLNNALRDAKTNGANRIVFPKGIYLISPTNPVIIDHQRTVIDLNGATLQIQSNGLPKYHIVAFVDGADGVRLYNGTLKGDWIARITNFRPATDVHFHHNEVSGNRRLGMAYCGGQRWLIESNHFAGNGRTAPGFGVDYEDGWELMQDVVFRNNTFKNNQAGDLVVCAGSELLFEGNVFEKAVSTAGRPHNYTFWNNRFTGGDVQFTTRKGTASIHDNLYSNCTLSITFDTKAVADGLYRPEGQTVVTPPLTLVDETLIDVRRLTGTYLCFRNSRLTRVKAVAGRGNRLIDFRNCELSDCALEYENGPTNILFQLDACQGAFREEGPGLGRKAGAAGR